MSGEQQNNQTASEQELQQMMAEADTGARAPSGLPAKILLAILLAWSLFQLWYSSPLPFVFGFGILNDTEARSIHLAFAIFLAFTAYPALKRSPRDRIPNQDWVFALVGAFCAAYLFLNYVALSDRSGAPTPFDMVVGVTGMLLLLEATRRALGPRCSTARRSSGWRVSKTPSPTSAAIARMRTAPSRTAESLLEEHTCTIRSLPPPSRHGAIVRSNSPSWSVAQRAPESMRVVPATPQP